MKSIVLINFYFGKFPNYFPLFLSSCKNNPDITWYIYTDNDKCNDWPDNVVYHYTTLAECKRKFQAKFDYPICLDNPWKLCDYKVAYGYILKEELKEYDYWGYCDLDVIYGNICKFITPYLEDGYDKIYSLGHFTLYRNNDKVNQVFLVNAKKVFTTPDMIGYDEWGKGKINDLFLKSNYKFYSGILGADVWPSKTNFYLSEINIEANRYNIVDPKPFIVVKNKEGLFLYNGIEMKEYAYIHIQKRPLAVECSNNDSYYIIPNKFIDTIDLNVAYKLGTRFRLIDIQAIKIRIKNMKVRIRKLFVGKENQ